MCWRPEFSSAVQLSVTGWYQLVSPDKGLFIVTITVPPSQKSRTVCQGQTSTQDPSLHSILPIKRVGNLIRTARFGNRALIKCVGKSEECKSVADLPVTRERPYPSDE